MTTNMKKILSLTALLMISLAFSACGKKSDDNNSVTATSYYMNGNQCYSNTNQPVAMTYCQTNGGYQMINGYCYLNGQMVSQNLCSSSGYYMNGNQCYSQNGQIAPMQYCQNTGTNGTTTQKQCFGQFIDQYGQTGQCNGYNCRGFTLREAATGLTVQCI